MGKNIHFHNGFFGASTSEKELNKNIGDVNLYFTNQNFILYHPEGLNATIKKKKFLQL